MEENFSLVFSDGTSMEMIHIPAGHFLMGSRHREGMSYPDEKPQHEVMLKSFWIGRYPVTVGQFALFLEERRDSGWRNLFHVRDMSLN